jgi:hypothetical protein
MLFLLDFIPIKDFFSNKTNNIIFIFHEELLGQAS